MVAHNLIELQNLISRENFCHDVNLLLNLFADDVGVGEKLIKNLHVTIVATYKELFVNFLFNGVLYFPFGPVKDVGVAEMGSSLHLGDATPYQKCQPVADTNPRSGDPTDYSKGFFFIIGWAWMEF